VPVHDSDILSAANWYSDAMFRHVRLLICIGGLFLSTSQSGAAFADSEQFSGSLVAVTRHSIWVRQPNGVVVLARLNGAYNAETLLSHHKVGDQVLLKVGVIDRVFEDEEGQWFDWEVTSLDYLRPPSTAEVASAVGSAARRQRGNLLRNPEGEAPRRMAAVSLKTLQIPDASSLPRPDSPEVMLERFRALIQKWVSALPNFTVDELTSIQRSPASNPPQWKISETMQSEVSFQGTRSTHKNVVRNGVKWDDAFEHLPAAPRAGVQHGLLGSVFNPGCDAKFVFSKRATEAGTPVMVYRFTAPPESPCFIADWGHAGERFYAGRVGEVAIAEADGLIRRLESASVDLPKGFMNQVSEVRAVWDTVLIGEERHLLPTEVQFLQVKEDGTMSLSTSRFKNHRHFEANSTISFK
jgi:hypothetical protein